MKTSDVPDLLVLRLVAEYMEAMRGYDWTGSAPLPPSVLDCLQDEHGVPLKVATHKIERLTEQGLLDYGVSVRFPWVTDAGLEALAAAAERF